MHFRIRPFQNLPTGRRYRYRRAAAAGFVVGNLAFLVAVALAGFSDHFNRLDTYALCVGTAILASVAVAGIANFTARRERSAAEPHRPLWSQRSGARGESDDPRFIMFAPIAEVKEQAEKA